MATQDREYLTLPEVAERYRKPISTVRYWRVVGFGPKGVRCGSSLLYPMAEIIRFDRELREREREHERKPAGSGARGERA
jgi:hypothetical protein